VLGLAQRAPRLDAPRAGVFSFVRPVLVFSRAKKSSGVGRVNERVAKTKRNETVRGRRAALLRGEETAERLAALAHSADTAQARELRLPVWDVKHAP